MLHAYSDSELQRSLAAIDISVPKRTEGRTKAHTERYAISYLLSALIGKNRISYPLCLIQRERPDFLLTMGNEQIGIEHTEAVPENDAHKIVLRDAINGPDVYFISHHQPGEAKKTAKELIAEIKANKPGDGWTGDSAEREWADAMFHFIERKVSTVSKKGFQRFAQDWLLIYDNWRLPAVNRYKATSVLHQLLSTGAALNEFARIYIITGQYLCEISNAGMQLLDIKDLWS